MTKTTTTKKHIFIKIIMLTHGKPAGGGHPHWPPDGIIAVQV